MCWSPSVEADLAPLRHPRPPKRLPAPPAEPRGFFHTHRDWQHGAARACTSRSISASNDMSDGRCGRESGFIAKDFALPPNVGAVFLESASPFIVPCRSLTLRIMSRISRPTCEEAIAGVGYGAPLSMEAAGSGGSAGEREHLRAACLLAGYDGGRLQGGAVPITEFAHSPLPQPSAASQRNTSDTHSVITDSV